MSDNEFLPLPDNPGCYEELKDGNCYFVDKTEYLKTVFTSSVVYKTKTFWKDFAHDYV